MDIKNAETPAGNSLSRPAPHKGSSFYPADYLVMTLTSLAMLGALAGLGAMLIDYWLNGTSGILAEFNILLWIATLVIVVPIHLLAYVRVRRTNSAAVTQFSLRVAHGLLGLFLLATVLTFIALCTWLVFNWLNAFVGTASVDKHLLTTTLVLLQAIAWYAYATWHFGRIRSSQSRPIYYVLTVGIFSVALVALSFAFPVPAYHDVARDFVRESDLSRIEHAVDEYTDTHSKLPAHLHEETGLDQETTRRLGDYTYKPHGGSTFGIFGYELCATFAKSSGSGTPSNFGYGSHGTGKQCFARFTISGSKLERDLVKYVHGVEDGAAKLGQTIQRYLAGVEGDLTHQLNGLEQYLEGLEVSTGQLQQEMQRLETNMNSLQGNTGQLNQDFQDVEKFIHDLLCGIFSCESGAAGT